MWSLSNCRRAAVFSKESSEVLRAALSCTPQQCSPDGGLGLLAAQKFPMVPWWPCRLLQALLFGVVFVGGPCSTPGEGDGGSWVSRSTIHLTVEFKLLRDGSVALSSLMSLNRSCSEVPQKPLHLSGVSGRTGTPRSKGFTDCLAPLYTESVQLLQANDEDFLYWQVVLEFCWRRRSPGVSVRSRTNGLRFPVKGVWDQTHCSSPSHDCSRLHHRQRRFSQASISSIILSGSGRWREEG